MSHKNVLESFRLDGKIALVTGGARGLGRTMATALAEAGRESAEGIAAATGRRARGFAADVTRLADVERLATEVEAELGPVDILVNNAGINIRGPLQQLTEADWDAVID